MSTFLQQAVEELEMRSAGLEAELVQCRVAVDQLRKVMGGKEGPAERVARVNGKRGQAIPGPVAARIADGMRRTKEANGKSVRKKVLDAMTTGTGPYAAVGLGACIDAPHKRVADCLSLLTKQGKVNRVGIGLYELAKEGTKTKEARDPAQKERDYRQLRNEILPPRTDED
jgi:hypothetical protein